MIKFIHSKAVSSCVKISRQALIGTAVALALTVGSLAADPAAEGTEFRTQAIALERAGKLAEAEDAYRKSMAVYEKAFGPTNPWVGAMLNAIGRVYIKQHRDAEAEPLLQRGLTIMESRLGDDSIEVVAPLTRLGTAYQNLQRMGRRFRCSPARSASSNMCPTPMLPALRQPCPDRPELAGSGAVCGGRAGLSQGGRGRRHEGRVG